MRLALGTVQFGLKYGIANQVGRVQLEDVKNILQLAAAQGVNTLDTAIAYGDSESKLGLAGLGGWRVVTKLPALPERCADVAGWVEAQIEGSLNRLGVSQFHAVLLHHPLELLGEYGNQLFKTLQDIKAQGTIAKIGVSVYGPEELEMLWPSFQFDLVQAPFNVIDRRLASSGWLERMHQSGTEVHVRSVFLQGLLLMSAEKRRANFEDWQDLWSKWDGWLIAEKLTPLQASLIFALSWPEIDRVIVGVDSASQLNEILSVTNTANTDRIDFPNYLESMDSLLTNPSKWKQL
jgi:aryl-alcohol dehydrogenase-like predicted oxidoreductase